MRTPVCDPLGAWAWRCSLGTSPTHREKRVRQHSAPWKRGAAGSRVSAQPGDGPRSWVARRGASGGGVPQAAPAGGSQ